MRVPRADLVCRPHALVGVRGGMRMSTIATSGTCVVDCAQQLVAGAPPGHHVDSCALQHAAMPSRVSRCRRRSRRAWHLRRDDRAGAGRAADAQPAVERLDAIGEAAQTRAAASSAPPTPSSAISMSPSVRNADPHRRHARVGVLGDVGQRLDATKYAANSTAPAGARRISKTPSSAPASGSASESSASSQTMFEHGRMDATGQLAKLLKDCASSLLADSRVPPPARGRRGSGPG